MVLADHRYGAGVLGPVATAPFAVVVRGVRVEARTAVVRIAFGGFFARFGFNAFAFFGFGLRTFFASLPASGFPLHLAPSRFTPCARFGAALPADLLLFPLMLGRDPGSALGGLPRFLFALGLGIGTAAG